MLQRLPGPFSGWVFGECRRSHLLGATESSTAGSPESSRSPSALRFSARRLSESASAFVASSSRAFCIGFSRFFAFRRCLLTASPHFCVACGFRVWALLVCESNAFVSTRATRTAGIRHTGIISISDDAFRLSHTCRFNLGRCGSRLCRHHVFESFSAFRSMFLSRHR